MAVCYYLSARDGSFVSSTNVQCVSDIRQVVSKHVLFTYNCQDINIQ